MNKIFLQEVEEKHKFAKTYNMQGCDNFREVTLRNCPENFIINAGLDATTTYGVEFKNKFNSRIFLEVETDEDGILTIPVDSDHSLVKDYFHSFSGSWQIKLFAFDEDEKPVHEQFCDGTDYIELIFEETSPSPDPNNATITIVCP